MSHASFLADAAATRDRGDWFLHLYPKNPAGVETLLRFSRRGTATGTASVTVGSITIPAHTPYRKRVLKAPKFSQSLWQPGKILSASLPGYGVATLQNADGGLDQYMPEVTPNHPGWQWAGCRWECLFGDPWDLPGTLGLTGQGLMGDPRFSLAEVEIPLKGFESLFAVPTSKRVYRGTSYMLELSGVRTISFGAPAAANLTGTMSAEGWLWIDTAPSADVLLWGWAVAGFLPWLIVLRSTRQLRFTCHVAGVAQAVTMSAVLAVGRWYHFSVAVVGRDVTFRVWDDDAETTTTEVFVNGISSATRSTNVGGTYLAGSSGSAVVWLDEWRLFNIERTLTKIEADRFRPYTAGAMPAGLVHRVAYDDGTGTTVVDSSATAANGTISGAGSSTWFWAQEGDASLAGTPKADVFGEKFGCRPVLVDPINRGYQVAGGGAVQNIQSFEGGNPHTMGATAASYRAYLVAAAPSAGNASRYHARGLFRLSGNPALPISATVQGYNAGGYVNTGGPLVRWIVTRRGPKIADPAGLDTASFTAYGTAAPAIVGVFLPQPIKIGASDGSESLLDNFLKSGGGWWGYDRGTALFKLARFTGPAVTADYSFTERNIITIEPGPPLAVVFEVVVLYRRNFVVHSEDEVAATIKGTSGWTQWTLEWQEKRATDETLRSAYPGDASVSVTVETALEYETDAQDLADALLALLKGPKGGWIVSVNATGLQARIGETASLALALRGKTRLGLDGSKRYAMLTVGDNRQEGTVNFEGWG